MGSNYSSTAISSSNKSKTPIKSKIASKCLRDRNGSNWDSTNSVSFISSSNSSQSRKRSRVNSEISTTIW